MFAVFEDGGRQYRVSEGERLLVDLRDAAEGDELTFDRVLLVADGEDVRVGTPVVEGARVSAVVEGREAGKKVWTMKFRRRKDSKTLTGHRQKYLRVRVTGIKT